MADASSQIYEQAKHIEALRERITFLESREQELTRALEAADDAERARSRERLQAQDRRVAELEDEVREANRVIEMMQSTRAWQLASSYWTARTAAKRLVRRG
jgi:predicted RNase H-like nuclease (RuvC/YqgF family)